MLKQAFAFSCLVMLAGCTPPAPAPVVPSRPAGIPAPTSGTTTSTTVPKQTSTVNAVKQVAMKIENMHCPVGCYPTVEKTLTSLPGVADVHLAEQKDPATIDNPVVYVDVDDKFDLTKAIAALNEEGFASELVRNN